MSVLVVLIRKKDNQDRSIEAFFSDASVLFFFFFCFCCKQNVQYRISCLGWIVQMYFCLPFCYQDV